MAKQTYLGWINTPDRWHSGVKLGGVNTPPLQIVVDSTLPSLGQDVSRINRDMVVIPRGRVLGTRDTNTVSREDEFLEVTLANGVDPLDAPSFANGTLPVGYAPFNIYRDFSGLPAEAPVIVNHETIEVPLTAINNLYNTATNGGTKLFAGELVMPFYGSAVKKAHVPKDVGKYVRYIPKKSYVQTQAASATAALTAAVFPAFKPEVLLAWNAGTLVTSGVTSLDYNETSKNWEAVFGGPVTNVLYMWGAAESQVIGRLLQVEPITATHSVNDWLEWVTTQISQFDLPPILNQHNFVNVTDEAVSLTNNVGTLANTPVIPYKTISVKVTGTLVLADGTSQTLSGETLALADGNHTNDQTQGLYYDIDMLKGTISFSSNLTITSVTVSYSYESSYTDGLVYDQGILGLTGRDSGFAGLAPHLDVAGVLGVMRIAIFDR